MQHTNTNTNPNTNHNTDLKYDMVHFSGRPKFTQHNF